MAATTKKDKPISRASAPRLLVRDKGTADGVPNKLSFGSESSKVTSLRAPAPLPPSPADSDPGGWLEQAQTDPTKIPDLGALAGTGHTDPGSLPGWAKGSRGASVNEELSESKKRGDRSADSAGATLSQSKGTPRVVVALLMAVCLAIGMIAGALLQSRSAATDSCPDPTAHSSELPG